MKNFVYKIISFFCAFVCVFVLCSSSFILACRAAVPSTQIVVGNNGTWAGLPFTFTTNGKYYNVQDSTGIPTSTYLAPNYFYTLDNEKFFVVDGLSTFTAVLNKIVGIIYEPNELNNLFTGFQNAINGTDTVNNKYIRNCLYDSNDNFLGYCLNDISGCYYGGNPPSDSNVKDDGNYADNVKNYYDYQNVNIPDYITFIPLSDSSITTNYTTTLTTEQINYFNEKIQDFDFCATIQCRQSPYVTQFITSYGGSELFYGYVDPVSYAIANNNSTWANFCSYANNNEVLATDLITIGLSDNGVNFELDPDCYNVNDQKITQYVLLNISSMTMTTADRAPWFLLARKYSNGWTVQMPFHKTITIYKNIDAKKSKSCIFSLK